MKQPFTGIPRTQVRRLGPLVATLALSVAVASAQTGSGGRTGGLPGSGGSGGSGTGGSTSGTHPLPPKDLVNHVLDRVTYGRTDAELDAIRQMGVDAYLRWQLKPDLVNEDPTLVAKLAALPPRTNAIGDNLWTWNELFADYLLRARHSRWQLNEVMTEFWSNHFDTGNAIQGGGFTGFYNSLQFDPVSGNPTVVYYDYTAGRPRYATWNGTVWNIMEIEGRGAGTFTSHRFSPTTRLPSASYYDPRNGGRLKVARYNGTTWTTSIVDAPASTNVGQWTSLRFTSAGNEVISYYDVTNRALRLATWNGTVWTVQTVDTGADVGMYSSLAIDASNRPLVAYYDNTNKDLKLASWNGTTWAVGTVDTAGDVGSFASLALDATGRPAISYYDATNGDLKYAVRNGATWTITVVDSAGNVGDYTSLAFTGGNPSIAYRSRTDAVGGNNYHLKLAQWNPATMSFGLTTIDNSATSMTGEWASLAFDSTGTPRIAFYAGSAFTLREAYLSGTPPTWRTRNIDPLGNAPIVYTGWELAETAPFRAKALGRFRDLLEVSATSPAMMLFLNNNENTAGAGNENYARELMELHTVGVDGGYNQTDVTTLAQALTGWGITPTSPRCEPGAQLPVPALPGFCYNHRAHDGTAHTVMGITFADDSANVSSNFMKQGEEILDMLAAHPSTGRFVCKKLIQKFVADTPPSRLWDACTARFLETDGDIERVLEGILFSEEFRSSDYTLNKVRTPLEFTIASLRNLEGTTDGYSLATPIQVQGMPLFQNGVPTGYDEAGLVWTSSNSLLQRWKWADNLTHFPTTGVTYVDPMTLILPTGITTADGVVRFFLDKLVRGPEAALARGTYADLIDCLTNGSPGTFNLSDPNTPARLRDTVDIILGFPEYQKQ